ncbi:class I SAM-dependent methyltransferase [Oscillatoriales cyanobacterium LEGE 11467]|uniref:Class I SAM-dependent methyltransferase n=1 Tax=Zarconia navalis LEGE 11467 TaxID=1828826 RepID=A0A928VZS0_9CYAN|nr:class I SAM-dependent methyltransferase [Zarconia navalis]MBE9042614.1 class I SAM-dependent methyltransferase [Zarconia navalis LEGE 11467]
MSKLNYYDKIAILYDRTRWMTETVAEDVTDRILSLVEATPKTSFLEPGVGTGLNILPLVKRGYSVTGIDISQEMLDRIRQKLNPIPDNLTLLNADASKLPFVDESFDVVLTVHMIHTVSNWRTFLDEIDRVLKPQGFYLNAQWITPPARAEFEGYFKSILSKYQKPLQAKPMSATFKEIDVETYLKKKKYRANYSIAKEWTVSNTVEELLEFFKLRAYGFCWRISDEIFDRALEEFEDFCLDRYGSLKTELSSDAKFEIWAYTAS